MTVWIEYPRNRRSAVRTIELLIDVEAHDLLRRLVPDHNGIGSPWDDPCDGYARALFWLIATCRQDGLITDFDFYRLGRLAQSARERGTLPSAILLNRAQALGAIWDFCNTGDDSALAPFLQESAADAKDEKRARYRTSMIVRFIALARERGLIDDDEASEALALVSDELASAALRYWCDRSSVPGRMTYAPSTLSALSGDDEDDDRLAIEHEMLALEHPETLLVKDRKSGVHRLVHLDHDWPKTLIILPDQSAERARRTL